VTPILSVKELEQLGYKIVVCPIESLMVCARVMRDLCESLDLVSSRSSVSK